MDLRHFISLYQVNRGRNCPPKRPWGQAPRPRPSRFALRAWLDCADDETVGLPLRGAAAPHRRHARWPGEPWGFAPHPTLAARQSVQAFGLRPTPCPDMPGACACSSPVKWRSSPVRAGGRLRYAHPSVRPLRPAVRHLTGPPQALPPTLPGHEVRDAVKHPPRRWKKGLR